jgi:hypothetical protein
MVTDSLLGYIKERQLQRDRWVTALQSTRVPLRLINGPADPVSGWMTGTLFFLPLLLTSSFYCSVKFVGDCYFLLFFYYHHVLLGFTILYPFAVAHFLLLSIVWIKLNSPVHV